MPAVMHPLPSNTSHIICMSIPQFLGSWQTIIALKFTLEKSTGERFKGVRCMPTVSDLTYDGSLFRRGQVVKWVDATAGI